VFLNEVSKRTEEEAWKTLSNEWFQKFLDKYTLKLFKDKFFIA